MLERRLVKFDYAGVLPRTAWIVLHLCALVPFLALGHLSATPQTFWRPPIRSFGIPEHGGANGFSEAAQDAQGRLYFAGSRLIRFDGQRWDSWPIASAPYLRSAAWSESSRAIYLGGPNELGYFDPELDTYVSLIDSIDNDHRPVGEVWHITTSGDEVFFSTDSHVYIFRQNQFVSAEYLGEARLFLHRESNRNDSRVLCSANTGWYRWTGDNWAPHERPAATTLAAWIDLGSQHHLEVGYYGGIKEHLNGETSVWGGFDFQNVIIVDAAPLADDLVAVATAKQGLLVFDRDGRFLYALTSNRGLSEDDLMGLHVDHDGNLWALGRNHITLIEFSSSARVLDLRPVADVQNLTGFEVANADLYLSDLHGLRVLSENSLRKIRESPPEFLECSGDRVIAATLHEVFELAPSQGNHWKIDFLASGLSVFRNGWAVPCAVGLLLSTQNGEIGSTELLYRTPNPPGSATVHNGEVVFPIANTGMATVQAQTLKVTPIEELPSSDPYMHLESLEGTLYLAVREGIFRQTRNGWAGVTPILEEAMLKDFAASPAEDALWAVYQYSDFRSFLLEIGPNGAQRHELGYALPGPIIKIKPVGNGRIYLATPSQLLQWSISKSTPHALPLHVRSGLLRHRDGTQESLTDYSRLRLGSDISQLQFHLSVPSYSAHDRIRLRTWMEGLESNWSPLLDQWNVSYNGLPAGRYTMHIRAESALGRNTEALSFPITVLPPWYQSRIAYVAWLFMLVGGTWTIFRIRNYQLRKRAAWLEEVVDQRTEDLRKANRAKSEFLAKMSHEIKNPLTGLIGIAHRLRRETALTSGNEKLIDDLISCTAYLRGTVEDILDFSKIEAGHIELSQKPFIINDILNHLESIYAQEADGKGLEFNILRKGPVDSRVRGDLAKIEQILGNLLKNAVHHTQHGRVTLTCECVALEDNRFRVLFRVEDTGPGIPAEFHKKIFEQFEQGPRSAGLQGTGLGLAIAKQYASLMGGVISLSSEVGVGSTFFFELDLVSGSEPVASNAALRIPAGLRILVAEDQPYNQVAIEGYLSTIKADLEQTMDGKTTLEMLRQQAFDLVLLDWDLPEMDGLEILSTAKLERLDIPPTVMVTAYTTREFKLQAEEAGASGFLTKPFTETELLQAILPHVQRMGGQRSEKVALPPKSASRTPAEQQTLIDHILKEGNERLQVVKSAAAHEDYDTVREEVHKMLAFMMVEHDRELSLLLKAIQEDIHAAEFQRVARNLSRLPRVWRAYQDRLEGIAKSQTA